MKRDELEKIVELEELARKVLLIQSTGKIVAHCHGCFDLMHPGHIKHFQAAARMGDVLVVTITPDTYVDKGPGIPAFNQQLRAESIAALQCVDFVSINRWPTAEETIKLLRPNLYVKGQEFENMEDKTGKLTKEVTALDAVGSEIRFTHEVVFSSTNLLNRYFVSKESDI